MGTSDRWCWIEARDGGAMLHVAGAWRLADVPQIEAALQSLAQPARVGSVEGEGLASLDTAGALALLRYLQSLGADPKQIRLRGFAPPYQRIVEAVASRLGDVAGAKETHHYGFFATVGLHATDIWTLISGHVNFLGATAVAVLQAILEPRRLRLRELAAPFEQVGINAIPVVSLVTFLIGIVFAYLLGLQAEKYGANIFVVDGVAIGMTREFSPIIVAVIIAGRSGAAFTAQLGTMRLTEETDAISVLGLSPMDVLVIPRLVAIMIALPLLVFVGDVMGNFGAMVMAHATLDIAPTTYVDRLHTALAPKHFFVGLVKAPVFAFFIALIGCRMGMTVSRDTRSIGINTTSTVVQSIVSVILLDAIFAVIFQQLGI